MLVPIDGSPLAETALLASAELSESLRAPIVLLRVVEPPVPGRFYAEQILDEMQEAQVREAEAYLGQVAGRLREDGIDVAEFVLTGLVAQTVVDYAGSNGCDLIVMGSHGLGAHGWELIGSVAQKVLHSAPVPVLIAGPSAAAGRRERELAQRPVRTQTGR